jgi:hypothetical protein
MEGKITIVEGADLRHLCDLLGVPKEDRPYRVRLWQSPDCEAVKVKVNEGMWSPALGRKDGWS